MENGVIEILLVEDNMQDAELTIRSFKKNNLSHHILHLRDGAQALNFIFPEFPTNRPEPRDHIQLILLDLKMPKVNGIEVLRRLKADERTRTIPAVILTSSRQEHDIREAYRAGASSYVVKPVGFDQFTDAVTQIGTYWLRLNQLSR